MSKKNNLEFFLYQMGQECDGQCSYCPYFYEIVDKKRRFRCFKKDIENYVSYQAGKHQ